MATPALKISRAQLAKICGNDHDMIRQFETLFSAVANASAPATDEGLTEAVEALELAPLFSPHTHAASEVSGVQAAANKRETVTLTLSATTGTASLGKAFEILDESASAAGRFRLYRTTTGRDADLPRKVGTSAPNNAGLLLEDVFTASALAVAEDPAPCSAGSDGLCAWSWSGATGATITLTILVKEV